ncbi:rRNA maturation RNase YbeY, partial [Streptococcus suis]
MNIEMIDETGQVSAQIQEKITELLQFAAEKIG